MEKSELVSAQVNKQALKDFFYLFTRRPDTYVKPYWKNILVKKDNIEVFVKLIIAELKAHHVDNAVITLATIFEKMDTLELNYDKFLDYDFQEAEPIETITISIEFMYGEDKEHEHDRYQLIVKITNGLSPMHMIQNMLANIPESVNQISDEIAPCLARINYINSNISENLIKVVTKWIKGLPEAIITKPLIMKIKECDHIIAPMLHYFPSVLIIILTALFPLFYSTKFTNNVFAIWLIITFVSLFISNRVGLKIARKTIAILQKIGKAPLFQITLGDKNLSDKLERDAINAKNSFIKVIFINILFGAIASIVAAIFLHLVNFQ